MHNTFNTPKEMQHLSTVQNKIFTVLGKARANKCPCHIKYALDRHCRYDRP